MTELFGCYRRLLPMFSIVLVTAFASLLNAEQPKGRTPVPDGAAQQKSLATIRELYTDDYRDDKCVLARKLIQKAREEQSPADRFALLWEAQNVAAEAIEGALALDAIDALANEFALSSLDMKTAVIRNIAEKAQTPEQKRAIAEAALLVVDEAIHADNFDVAKQMVRQAGRLSRLREVAAKNRVVEVAANAYADAQHAMRTLEEHSDDPDANLILGKYLCFSKRDWEKGLPMLALGSDKKLKALAEKDIIGAISSGEEVKLGDAWWDVARERAMYWYEKASPALGGLEKDRVEKRVSAARLAIASQADPQHEGRPNPKSQRIINLLSIVGGKSAGKSGVVVEGKGTPAVDTFTFPYEPPKEYDLRMTLVRTDEVPKVVNDTIVQVPIGGSIWSFCIRNDDGGHTVVGFFGDDNKPRNWKTVTPRLSMGRPFDLLLNVRQKGVKTYLNGIAVCERKSAAGLKAADSRALAIIVCNNRTVVTGAKVTELTGTGKLSGIGSQ